MTINGAAGSAIDYLGSTNTPAIINAGASNVTVNGAMGGAVTLFGGSGVDSVSFGLGSLIGGSAGGNVMATGQTAGATTLIGGGAGDQLYNNAAGNTLIGGPGAEQLVGTGFTSIGGAVFNTGVGQSTVVGDATGGNTVFLGGQQATVTGSNLFLQASFDAYNSANLGASVPSGIHSLGNDFYLTAAGVGGTDDINDFNTFYGTGSKGVQDVFHLGVIGGGRDSVASAVGFAGRNGGAGTLVTLSDGTKLYMYNYTYNAGDFKT